MTSPGVPATPWSAPSAPRRYVCRACGRAHAAWSARCPICNSLKGLERDLPIARAEDVPALVPRVPDAPIAIVSTDLPPVEAPVPTIVRPQIPRLTIARAPDPDLDDPIEELADVDDDDPIPLSEIPETTFVRDSTGLAPLDHVLGGGLVVASVVLLASSPGVGKSTLTLQMLDGLGHRCLYVTGEETREQIAATARRIGVTSDKIYVLVAQDLDKIFAKARAKRVQTIAIDSIQKMRCDDVGGRAGSPTQLKECTARLVQHAKTTGTSLWLIGHVTGDGDVAGPRTIEHDVDVVLELEQGAPLKSPESQLEMQIGNNERIIRCAGKNRFGPTNVSGRFELTHRGFVPVDGDGWNEGL